MKNILFYAFTVLIWGSSWIGIKFQLGTVDPMVSVTYRFGLAATLLLAWCTLFKMKMRFTLKDHLFIALQGITLFGINYLLFYVAELYLASGLAAVIFSTIVVMNMVNGALFLGSPFDARVMIGAALGLTGIILVFRPEFAAFTPGDEGVLGVVLSFAATFLASIGNIISARNQKHGLPVMQTNAYGMTYGALLMVSLALFSGKHFGFEVSVGYVSSLLFLAVFASIVAFGCYLSLIGRIGADRAAYATLLFPIVALAISTVFENYHWTGSAVIGVVMILFGNLLIIKKKKGAPSNPPGNVTLQRSEA